MHALLDRIRKNEAAVQDLSTGCKALLRDENRREPPEQVACFYQTLRHATRSLKILDSEVGDQELIKEVAAELAKLRELQLRHC